MEGLTSIDYATYLFVKTKIDKNIVLNKTQINKLLYISYSFFAALNDGKEVLFKDDAPKAWPFGPVFPRVYRRYGLISSTTESDEQYKVAKNMIESDEVENSLFNKVIEAFSSWTAYELTAWSHQKGSPWFETVYGDGADEDAEPKWNQEITVDKLVKFFKRDGNE